MIIHQYSYGSGAIAFTYAKAVFGQCARGLPKEMLPSPGEYPFNKKGPLPSF